MADSLEVRHARYSAALAAGKKASAMAIAYHARDYCAAEGLLVPYWAQPEPHSRPRKIDAPVGRVPEVPTSLQAWRAQAAGRILRISHSSITLIMHDRAGRWECSYPTLEATLAAIAAGPDWHRAKPAIKANTRPAGPRRVA